MSLSPFNFLIVLAGAPALLICLLAVVARIFRISQRGIPSQVIVLLCALLGNIPIGALAWFFYLQTLTSGYDIITGIIYFLITYNAIAYSFFHIFNMSDTARRIKILNEIKTCGKVKVSELSSSYNAREMLSNRIARLLDSRQIGKSGDGYVLNSNLLYYAAKQLISGAGYSGLPLWKAFT